MPALPIPVKKLRRNAKFTAFVFLLTVALWAAYLRYFASTDDWDYDDQLHLWNEVYPSYRYTSRREAPHVDVPKEDQGWRAQHRMQPWKPKYRGQANLHVFEDWCGSSVDQLRKNIHYPLYPHSRVTVKKLAVSPAWINYGLRIFGYLHPYKDGYLFAVASDDNSEFWLSWDESPFNLRLLVYVGKVGVTNGGTGEIHQWCVHTYHCGCFLVCVSHRLSAKKRYFFEVIHKQNDKGTDHVEVGWRLNKLGTSFTVINSEHISLYINETLLEMNDVGDIPQSAASHISPPRPRSSGVDMLREDPRDSFYKVPLINETYVHHVLPECSYKPSYTIKGFPLLRYQGLQFVHLSSIYPNDYTRLTHMETDNKCFYHENPRYLERFGFFNYMKMDVPETGMADYEHRFWNKPDVGVLLLVGHMGNRAPPDEDDLFQYEEDEEPPRRGKHLSDYGDDYNDYAFRRKRKLLSLSPDLTPVPWRQSDSQPQEATGVSALNKRRPTKTRKKKRSSKRQKAIREDQPLHLVTDSSLRMNNTNADEPEHHLTAEATPERKIFYSNVTETLPVIRVRSQRLTNQTAQGNQQSFRSRWKWTTPEPKMEAVTRGRHQISNRKGRLHEDKMNESLKLNVDWAVHEHLEFREIQRPKNELKQRPTADAMPPEPNENGMLGFQDESEFEEEQNYNMINPALFDPEVNWDQTFDVNPMDLQMLRSDWIDLQCNVSGNLLLNPTEALPVVEAFMRKLNQKNSRRFSLLRVVNVERRVDGSQGSRYLLELELRDESGARLRLSHYVYVLQRHSHFHVVGKPFRVRPLLCNPRGLSWKPSATVHFIVPVKNQGRWVQQFITDMEVLYRTTRDKNFNIIITDFNSADMNVELALKKSALPRHQYLKLTGNFERSAGLQAGIDLITDDHSIVFLCDLHIHFPPSIVDTIRKHCVEGKMAFAPIVMRLNCGATPQEPNGFWEVNGFGLLGIYKSDLDKAGGMNTKDFRDHWGGEDWELLDRILQAGLEVERIYLRNFMHYYHSRRGMWNRQSVKSV
ncbi:beta-1,4-N-acetylgalactosaminyltransferase 3-like [Arapaima gigas]